MQADLLIETSGLVLDIGLAESLVPADKLRRGDDEGLTQILYGLAALHRHLGRGCGNLDAKSLRRTTGKEGRLVLLCTTTLPSRCESTKRNDIAGRYFLHIGEQARDVDDLVSLGIIAAELLVPPQNRPALSDDHGEYRNELAERIPKAFLRREDRVRNRLIRLLLHLDLDKDSQLTSAQFLRDHVALVDLTSNTRLKPASWSDAVRYFPKSSLFALAVVALSIVSLWMLWRGAQSAYMLAQRDLESSIAKVSDLEQKVAHIPKPVICKPTPPNPLEKSIPVEVLKSQPRYLMFENDRNLKDNTEFQSLLKETTLGETQVAIADATLNDLVNAAKVWWEIAESQASDREVTNRFDGQTNARVRQILKVWYAEAVTSKPRTITLTQSSVPADYNTYRYRISFLDVGLNKYVYGEPNEDLFVQKGNTLEMQSGKAKTYSLKWKAGQAIPFWLEYWYGPYLSWVNVMTQQANGALALPLFAKQSWEQDGFSMSFEVSPLPGPPVKSANMVPGRIPMPISTPISPGKTGLPIILENETN